MTIEQYLQGKVDFNLTDANLQAILYDHDVAEGAQMYNVSEKQKDLCLADVYMLVANSSVSSSGEYESDGGWQRQVSAKNVQNREGYRALAKALYDKWSVPATTTSSKIVSRPLY